MVGLRSRVVETGRWPLCVRLNDMRSRDHIWSQRSRFDVKDWLIGGAESGLRRAEVKTEEN
jgi:hypothetical protein